MVARATPRAAAPFREEGRAAARTLLTTTTAIGGMVMLIDLAVGSTPVVAAPSLALLAGRVGVWKVGWTATLRERRLCASRGRRRRRLAALRVPDPEHPVPR